LTEQDFVAISDEVEVSRICTQNNILHKIEVLTVVNLSALFPSIAQELRIIMEIWIAK
jgi:hypothetical protein